MIVQSIAFLMTYNVLQPRMLPTVTRNVTFACTGVARRAAGGEEAGRGREEKRKEGEEETGRGSRIGRDGSRTRCANAIKILPWLNVTNASMLWYSLSSLEINLVQDERAAWLVCCKGKAQAAEEFWQQ